MDEQASKPIDLVPESHRVLFATISEQLRTFALARRHTIIAWGQTIVIK